MATESEKDDGMNVTSNLKPSGQAANADRKVNLVLGQLARGVTEQYSSGFKRLLFSLIPQG